MGYLCFCVIPVEFQETVNQAFECQLKTKARKKKTPTEVEENNANTEALKKQSPERKLECSHNQLTSYIITIATLAQFLTQIQPVHIHV